MMGITMSRERAPETEKRDDIPNHESRMREMENDAKKAQT
jgi:hypothetical protein